MPDNSYEDADYEASRRRAVENQRTDEYGLAKPAVSWTERLTDIAYPPEVAGSDRPWYVDMRGFLAIPAAGAGHVMDELAPFDTRFDLRMPKPVLGELGHGAHVAEYQQEHAEAAARAEEEARQQREFQEYLQRAREEAGPQPECAPGEPEALTLEDVSS